MPRAAVANSMPADDQMGKDAPVSNFAITVMDLCTHARPLPDLARHRVILDVATDALVRKRCQPEFERSVAG
jgi:hypothetical protein